MTWLQNYDPLASPVASTLLAAAPICLLLGFLVAGLAAERAAIAGLLAALAVAIFGFGMPTGPALAPLSMAPRMACCRSGGSSWQRYSCST